MTQHPSNRPHIPASLAARIDKLKSKDVNGVRIVEEFGMFIDTHRDQPHVGTFADDIHRGMCLPTMVDYAIDGDMIRNRETGKFLLRHDKHLFIEPDEWGAYLIRYMMDHGVDPRDGSGAVPTSHFRDARAKIYLLRSFRQMVGWNEHKK